MNFDKDELFDKLISTLIKKAEGYFYQEEICEYQTEEKVENNVSQQLNFLDNDINLNQKSKKEVLSDARQKQREKEVGLVLLKKKITTHHVPPDMLAIKMLYEICGEKVDENQSYSDLSDEELDNVKNELIEKLKNIKKEITDVD